MPTYSQSYRFRDARGQTSTMRMFVQGADEAAARAAATAIRDALIPLSNAALEASFGALTDEPGVPTYGTAVAGDFKDVEHKLSMVFSTDSGSIHRYGVPAPKVAMFAADGESMDATVAAIVTARAAIIAGAASRDGQAITAMAGGYLRRVRSQRKNTVWTKNPALTGPGL